METEYKNIKMTLIGEWIDLAYYYRGSDGNAWSFSRCTNRWSNMGEIESFILNFEKRYRGKLF